MVAPTLRLAVAIGAMEKRARRTFRRRAATPPETVSGLRRACRHQSHALPRMRRQPALFSRRLEQETLPLIRRERGSRQYRLGASFGPAIFFENQWWRPVTAMFLHAGLVHIGFNMMALMQLGPPLEELYGSARYLFFYMVTGAF